MSRLKMSVLAVLAMGASSCGGEADTTDLSIDLYTAGEQIEPGGEPVHSDLLQGVKADVIEMVLVNTSDPFNDAKVADLRISERGGKLPGLPLGEGYQLFIRGFLGDDVNPVFFGGSLPFGVTAGDDSAVAIQIGRADCVGLNQSSRLREPDGKDDMVQLRVGMTMTALPDGRVLLIGGGQLDGQGNLTVIENSMELYDPNKGQFVELDAQLSEPRAYHTATVLPSGEVLVVGGVTASAGANVTASGSASLIDVNRPGSVVTALQNAFDDGVGRYGHQASPLSDDAGSVLITGGQSSDGTPLATTYRFFPGPAGDTASGQFRRQGDLMIPRFGHASAPLRRNSELAVVGGGIDADGNVSDSIEIYTVNPRQDGCTEPSQRPGPEDGCFIRPSGRRLAEARWGHRAISVDRGRQVLFLGGHSDLERVEQAAGLELLNDGLDIEAGGSVGELRFARGEMTATVLSDSSILVLGGRRADTPLLVGTRLQPQTSADGERVSGYAVTELAAGCDMSEPRYGHEAVLMASGTVLIGGGATSVNGAASPSRRAEIYFPRVTDLTSIYPR